MKSTNELLPQGALALSVLLFLACLATKGVYDNTCSFIACGPTMLRGWALLLVGGWMVIKGGITGIIVGIAWFANPCLIVTWCTFVFRPIVSLCFSTIAAGFIISFFFTRGIDSGLGLGYWFWLSSAMVMVITNALLVHNTYTSSGKSAL